MRPINRIIVHCSAGDWGDVPYIDRLHLANGWRGIGYHYVIENGYPTYNAIRDHLPDYKRDGLITKGRELSMQGAHVHGHNADSIGVCLIGHKTFTGAQIMSLQVLIKMLRSVYGDLKVERHCDLDSNKTCPNLDMEVICPRNGHP